MHERTDTESTEQITVFDIINDNDKNNNIIHTLCETLSNTEVFKLKSNTFILFYHFIQQQKPL